MGELLSYVQYVQYVSMYVSCCYGMSTKLFFYWLLRPAMEAAESRLGPAWNRSTTRFRCCSCCTAWDGTSALRAQCPLPMGTRCASPLYERLEQPLPPGKSCANGLAVRFDGGEGGEAGLVLLTAGASCLRSLWRLQRNEPGWFVGEHMHDRRILGAPPTGEEGGDETLTDLTGEPATESLTRESEADW